MSAEAEWLEARNLENMVVYYREALEAVADGKYRIPVGINNHPVKHLCKVGLVSRLHVRWGDFCYCLTPVAKALLHKLAGVSCNVE